MFLSVKPTRSVCRWLLPLLGAALVLTHSGRAQTAPNWRVYRAADGLRESLCTAVTISPRGNVWIKHGDVDAVSWVDGYAVGTVPAGGSGNFRVHDNRTGQLWSYCNAGLTSFQGGKWAEYAVPEIQIEAATNLFRLIRQTTLLPTERNRALVLLSDRLLEFNVRSNQTTLLRRASDPRLGRFFELVEARDGGAWVTGSNGLAKLPSPAKRIASGTPWQEFLPPTEARLQNFQRPFEDDQGGVCCVADSLPESKRVLAYFDGQRWQSLAIPGENLRAAWRGDERTFWALTINSLFRVDLSRPDAVTKESFPAGQFYDVAVEPKGVFWLATSEGLLRYAPLAWRSPPDAPEIDLQVHAIREDREERLWFASADALWLFQNGRWLNHPWPRDFEPMFQASDALYDLPNGEILITAADRFLLFDPQISRFSSLAPPAERAIEMALGQFPDGRVVLRTALLSPPNGSARLALFNGRTFESFLELPSPASPTNKLSFLAATASGDYWLGTSTGPLLYRDQKWQAFTRSEGYVGEAALCFLDVGEGRVWCGGVDRIFEYDGKSWRLVRAGFDRIHALSKGRDGSVWVATGHGLARYFKGSWMFTGIEDGLPSATVYDVWEDRRGRVWAGTTRGLSLLRRDADLDPPRTHIDPTENPTRVLEGSPVTLVFGARDKWQYTPTERLLYSYRVDEGGWSPYAPDTTIVLTNPGAGSHRFEVRAMDRNWNEDTQPAALTFVIIVPWYKEARLVAITAAGALVALILGGIAVNRHWRLVRSYAEIGKIVEQRTGELERANRELFHSQKMKALGTLSAGIAHDFNSILSIIKGSAQIIEANLEDKEKIRTRVDRIQTVVEQGSGVVKALLGFSRLSDKETSPCDVTAVVDATMKLLGDQFLQDVRVRFAPPPTLPQIPGAKDLIQQMLLNLILNASDAMGGAGEIVLHAGTYASLPEGLVLSPAPAVSYVFIAVQDFGCGIEPDVLPRIFEPFFTTKAFSTRRGTGLGLSMVYEFAKEMGYGLHVESAEGKGSTFTMIIPLKPALDGSSPLPAAGEG